MKNSWLRLAVFTLAVLLIFSFSCKKKEEAVVEEEPEEEAVVEEKAELDLDEIPQAVMDSLMAKFPEAEIQKWTKEQEEDVVIYDMEFKQGDQKFEADIKEDGFIHNWEKEIKPEDLPEAVQMTVKEKYPEASIKEIMEINMVKEGKDVLEGYEVVLETAEMEEVEITVAPDGKVLEEESGVEKKEEEK